MNMMKKVVSATIAFGLLASGSALAGNVTISNGSGVAGGQASVTYSYEQTSNTISSYTFVVEFDQTVLEPVVIGGVRNVVGCLQNLPAEWVGALTTCRNVAGSGEIVLVLSEQSGEGFGDFLIFPTTVDMGPIRFDIPPDTAPGNFVLEGRAIVAADPNLSDITGSLTVGNGNIEVLDLSPELSLAPLVLTFTAQQGTTSAAQQVVATNTGDLDGLIFDSFNFGGDGFAQNNDCPIAAPGLAIGASCSINIEFAPLAAGDFNTNFTVATTNGGTGVVAITATGTLGPQSALSVSGPLDFGSIDLNDLPDTAMITATNTGDAGSSLTISAVNYTGDTAFEITSNGCAGAAGTLADNQSCTVQVSFNTAAAGNYTGAVSFTSNAATNPTPSVSVLGTATATANISVNPDFGPVPLGTGEAGETLTANGTITNSGSAAADVSCVLDDPSGVFSTTPSPLTATVNANSTVPFALSCALPTAGEQGDAYAATLTCSVDRQEVGVHELSCDITDFVPVPVPTMSSWSIALFALLMLLVGGFSIRMFRIQ